MTTTEPHTSDGMPIRAGTVRWSQWALPLGLAVVLFVALWPCDLWLHHRGVALAEALPSDLRREWFAWQQYGQGVSLIVVASLIAMLDRGRSRRLLDLAAAVVVAFAVYKLMKMGIGRPRPRTGWLDPESFPGPWGVYPLKVTDPSGMVHEKLVNGWSGYSDVWSMPSSHAMMAVVLSVFLTRMYPRLKWPAVLLAAVTITGRVIFGAHWATDVAVGGCIGYAAAACATDGFWGVRALDWVWGKTVGHSADRPRGMWEEVVADERRRLAKMASRD